MSSTLDTMYSGEGPFCGLGNFISWLIECIAPEMRGAVESTAWLAAATSASVALGVPSTRPAERAAVWRKDWAACGKKSGDLGVGDGEEKRKKRC